MKPGVVVPWSCVVSLLAPLCLQAQPSDKYPSKPITIIVPFEPGADTDTSARLLAKYSEKFLGQRIIIKNKGGAAGILGFNEGVAAPADGYILTVATPSMVVTPHTVKGTKHYVKAFDPVFLPVGAPFVFVVNAGSPWKSFRELLDYARSNPERMRISNTGNAGLVHILSLGLEGAAGVRFTHVPYKGSGPGMVALLGGHVDGMLGAAGTVLQHVKNGKLRALAIGAPERYSAYAEAPTFKELGFNVDASTWWGYVVPKGTPRHIVEVIASAFRKAIDTPEYKESSDRLLWVIYRQGPEAFGRFLDERDTQWSSIINKLVQEGTLEPSR
ncbi:MAG: tripartite tricarboxylate transporter substrate binding protein [Betaproteobacteria bacterium]|nr:tripartite tricarboxylate transporter substrate binding protein [Betaproteobacteria bacterium]